MFEKDLIGIDINSERISILVGNRYKIEYGTTIEMPENYFENDRLQNVLGISELIKPITKKFKGKIKDVAFVLRGQDIITRHLILPMATEEAMKDTVEFEFRQFIGDRVDEYYIDYEIIHYDKNEGTGNADILMVGVEKTKIDEYLALGKELGLNVKAIDVYANVMARVFKNIRPSVNKGVKTMGIINLDKDSASIAILDWNRLSIEKYQGYGVAKSSPTNLNNNMDYNAFLDSINLIDVRENETETDIFFNDMISQYNSLIQYFTAGKVKKNLDRIFVIGTATRIKGVEQYLEVNLNSKVGKTIAFTDLKSSVKVKGSNKKIQLKDYVFPYGLLLRRE